MNRLNKELLISYSYLFISYLFRDVKINECAIKAIYLFGSVVRNDFDKESDIDIFIESDSENKEVKKIIDRTFRRFLNSEENKKFNLLGIENEIKVITGKLEEWELKGSIEKDGLLLYSQTPITSGLRQFFLVSLSPIKESARRNMVFRKLIGRQEKYYKEKGMIDELGGEKVQNNVFIVPSDNMQTVLQLFSKEKVDYKIRKIWK